jgi:hypothetical protein
VRWLRTGLLVLHNIATLALLALATLLGGIGIGKIGNLSADYQDSEPWVYVFFGLTLLVLALAALRAAVSLWHKC